MYAGKHYVTYHKPHWLGLINIIFVKPLSHWTATVLRQLATDIASGSQSSLETVASSS